MQLFVRPLVVGAALAGAAPAFAQLDNLAEQLRTTPITTQKIADNFHVLFGVGGNIIVSIGVNGTLIVDGQFPQMVPKYKAKIGELGGGKIDFVINTHWHFDHTDGNEWLHSVGAEITAHENTRKHLVPRGFVHSRQRSTSLRRGKSGE